MTHRERMLAVGLRVSTGSLDRDMDEDHPCRLRDVEERGL